MTLETFLAIAHFNTSLSPVVAGIALYHFKKRNILVKLLGLDFLLGFLTNITALLFWRGGHFKYVNLPMSLYFLSNFSILSALYFYALKKQGLNWFVLAVITCLIFGIVNICFIQKTSVNSYSFVLQSFIIVMYALIYFFYLLAEQPARFHHLPMFWFNSAFILFHAGNFFLFAFTSYLVNVLQNRLIIYWSFHNGLSIVEHFMILTGLYYDLRKK